MTTTKNKSNFIFILFMLIILGFTIALLFPKLPPLGDVEIVQKSHALEKHGTDATLARENCSQGGDTFYNKKTGRVLKCNRVDNNKWAIQILEKIGDDVEEVTSFIKNKMTSYDQVCRYIENCGYKLR